MRKYVKEDPWCIIEEGFDASRNLVSESIFSLGNGRFGQRGNFEEYFSGNSFSGNYIAGVYYPDKTRVGWWKIGYPDYYAKVLNSMNWLEMDIWIGGERLDLAVWELLGFKRILYMKEAMLERRFQARSPSGTVIEVCARRFCSKANDRIGAIQYQIRPVNFSGDCLIHMGLNGNVVNRDANYGEKFWEEQAYHIDKGLAQLHMRTKKTAFQVQGACHATIYKRDQPLQTEVSPLRKESYAGLSYRFELQEGETYTIEKLAGLMNMDRLKEGQEQLWKEVLSSIRSERFETLLTAHIAEWANTWSQADIRIEGDVAAQQAIRFNILQLNQTYTGQDVSLNIGPKGFTGEKYGGSTYWDTEAYCIPFYLGTAPASVARNLLLYRYRHLAKAIQNAEKLGFGEGAALYPMVTMNGEECHNEWEITFEEIHRNGAIAYAIFNYVRYTGDEEYIKDYGLEVLIAISRFSAQRVNWSSDKQKYMILGVTGPNEYENNVDNNWYTNRIAAWCMDYTREMFNLVQLQWPERHAEIINQTAFDSATELGKWQEITENMYYPYDQKQGIFLQQDGYLDKEQLLVPDLDPQQRPLNQHWSWDRILRSPFIKQADVLQGLYFLDDDFDRSALERNYNYYEPRTVHESSLSPCVHSILAARLGDVERAYEHYVRTARLDLDNYNHDTDDGLHITSMAGTWMSIVEGFAGMKVRSGRLHLSPLLPRQWTSYSFFMHFRDAALEINVSQNEIRVKNHSSAAVDLRLYEIDYRMTGEGSITHERKNLLTH